MSKRKRYRRLRNKVMKDNLKLFEANRRAKRQAREAEELNEQLGRARLMYETFKTELCSEDRTPQQVIAAFEAFKDVIKKVVKEKHARTVILNEIHMGEVRFIEAYGPKSDAQKAQWRAEAKRLRTSNRRPPEEPVKPVNN